MKIDYTNLSFTQLIDKIEKTRFFDLPRMTREAFTRLLTRVESLETSTEPPYKVYTALLTQSGTDAPVATVLENTLGTVEFTYEGEGVYNINSNDLFTENKTHFYLNNNSYTLAAYPSYSNFDFVDISTLRIVTTDSVGNIGIDGNLYYTPIEIRVYN